MRTYSFPAIIEHEGNAYGAFFPDLPGCVTAAEALDVLPDMAREALTLHLAGMLEDGETIPEPTPLERLPRDAGINAVGTLLVSAAPHAAKTVTVNLSETALQHVDEAAQRSGTTREWVISQGVERLFAAE